MNWLTMTNNETCNGMKKGLIEGRK